MELLSDPNAWLGFLTLTLLEIVLGIDNIVFISILTGRLPPERRAAAQRLGLGLAVVTRVLFLLSISWIMRLDTPLFSVFGQEMTGRSLVLVVGGLFLVWKATHEIHNKLEGPEGDPSPPPQAGQGVPGAPAGGVATAWASTGPIIFQILLIDLVFSIDSVVTAVGMVDAVEIMIAAVMVSVAFMVFFITKVSRFVEAHPTVKMLALAFLVLIGVNLIADGFGQHIPKGYTYFAMAFSLGVEMLNLRVKRGAEEPVELRHGFPD